MLECLDELQERRKVSVSKFRWAQAAKEIT
jgi:hypothetical protein